MATKLVSVQRTPLGKRCDFHEAHPDYMLPDKGSCYPAWCLYKARDYELVSASNAAERLADDLLRALEEKSGSTCCGTHAGSVIAIRALLQFMERRRTGVDSTLTEASVEDPDSEASA